MGMGSWSVGPVGPAGPAGRVGRAGSVGTVVAGMVGQVGLDFEADPAGCCCTSWGTVRCSWTGCWRIAVL